MSMARRLSCLLSILCLSLVARAVLADEPPKLAPFTAEYSLSQGYLTLAKVKIALAIDDRGKYRYSAHTTPAGLTAVLHSDKIDEISNGMISGENVIPHSYLYRHQNANTPRSVQVDFDWQAMRAKNSLDGTSWSMKISPGTQDKFSQQLALMLSMAAGKLKVDFPVADGGRAKDYSFRFESEERVDLAAGSFETLKMSRTKSWRTSQASLWLAPKLNFLPVIVERKEKDGVYLMKLERFSWSEQGLEQR